MAREVQDVDGVTWTCVQALAGVSPTAAKTVAAQLAGADDAYAVVCTPSGGARSVRLALPAQWDTVLDDEALLAAIAAERVQDA